MTESYFNFFKKTLALYIVPIFKDPAARKCCWLAGIFIIFDIVASALVPYFSKRVVDTLGISIAQSVSLDIGLLGFFWTLEKISTHLQEIVFFPAINNTIRNTVHRVVTHVHQLPLSTYQTLSIPEIISSIKRISLSARFFIKVFFLLALPTLIKLSITAMVAVHYGMFGLILIPATALFFIVLVKGTIWYLHSRESSWQVTDRVIMRVNDSLYNTTRVRYFYEHESKVLSESLGEEALLWNKTNIRLHGLHMMLALLMGATFTFILCAAFYGIHSQHLSIGDFVLLKTQLLASFLPLKKLSLEFRELAEAVIDIKKIIKLLDLPIHSNTKGDPKKSAPPIEVIEIKKALSNGMTVNGVQFGYTSDRALLKNLSLHVNHGEKILIMGENGCGKTSLLNLMAGLQPPSQGKIYLHQKNIADYSMSELRQLLHYIPQDFKLFNMSLRANITYGLGSAVSDASLLEAFEKTQCLTLLNKLPRGLDTAVGEMGTCLSGGEIQRIAIIRALLLKPTILLLDETLHSVDPSLENVLLNTLQQGISTIVFVSHRPISLYNVDRAYKLQGGMALEISVPTRNHLTQVRSVARDQIEWV